MTHVTVTSENCATVAQDLIDFLKDKEFSIVSYFKGDRSSDPRGLSLRKIKGGFSLKNGVLKIPLLPSRNITWDVNKETVIVTHHDNDMILIERIVNDKSTIFRMIVTH